MIDKQCVEHWLLSKYLDCIHYVTLFNYLQAVTTH